MLLHIYMHVCTPIPPSTYAYAHMHTPTCIHAQVVAFGLLTTEHAYLKSGWNQLDALIALICVSK